MRRSTKSVSSSQGGACDLMMPAITELLRRFTMSYKIVLKRSFTSGTFVVSDPANNPAHVRKVVQEMYEG